MIKLSFDAQMGKKHEDLSRKSSKKKRREDLVNGLIK
jgi:hypothetical protein